MNNIIDIFDMDRIIIEMFIGATEINLFEQ
jgi:hypothetical protein